MPGYSLGHLEDHVLLRDLTALARQDRVTTATLLAHIGEVDARRLYADAAYTSMFDYCVRVLGFSEDVAGKRMSAARIARRFPPVLAAVEEGRLHVAGLCVLARHLRRLRAKDAIELLAAAENKTRDQIRDLVAERFPQADLVASVQAAQAPGRNVLLSHAPGRVEVRESLAQDAQAPEMSAQQSPAATCSALTTPATSPSPAPPARAEITPLSPGRYGLKLTISAETNRKLERAKKLLSRVIDPNDLEALFDRALDALLEKIERRRFAATDRPRSARPSKNARHIPATLRRAVKARDGGQCTFVSDDGRRCEETADVEHDHIEPVARGGKSTLENLRLRCHAHNQLAAERVFGAGFMQEKRQRAQGSPAAQ